MIFDKLIKQESDIIKLITDHSKVHGNLLITYLNQHCYNIYNSNTEYRDLLNNDFMVFPDGFGVYAALKFLRYKGVKNFNATDVYSKIFEHCSTRQTGIFIIGGNFSDEFINKKADEKQLIISGYHNGYFQTDKLDGIINAINKSSAEIIIIGAGVPKQEIIAEKMASMVRSKCILCVGGFLEFYFGTKKRAPVFLRKAGFEWLFRLITEPKRLWKRYLIGIPEFLISILKIKFTSAN